MKVIDNRLYLEFSDAIKSGISQQTLWQASMKNSPSWTFIDDPRDGRKRLIDFEKLKSIYKEKVVQAFGDPYSYITKEPLRKMVIRDIQAEKFFTEYVFEDNKRLPIETIEAYTTAASWLNMLVKAGDDKKSLKQLLGLTVTEFWVKVIELFEEDNIKLPTHVLRLREKISQYKELGYSVLISKKFGKPSGAKKVDCQVSQSLLLELISMPNQSDQLICRRYNQFATENGKKEISVSAVKDWRKRNLHLIAQQKFGLRENYNTYGKITARSRPSAPLLLVEHDDNDLDLYFQSVRKRKDPDSGKTSTEVYYFHRFVLAVVIDAYNDYPLGWAIADTYTKDLIKFAYLDAVHHINELTGSWYLPYQIRSDRFGLAIKGENDLSEFYKSICSVYTPATVGVPRGKYIEQSFGRKWHDALGIYKNYSGSNITSKRRVPQETITANKKEFPHIDEAPAQAAHFINILRHLISEKSGLSKQEEWVKAFTESEKSKVNLISEAQMLLKLGQLHEYQNTITNRGITPAINCIERTYEIPEELYLQTIGKKVQVIFDRMDYSRILVTDGQGLHFIAREQELMPSAIADYKPGDRAKINDRLEQKARFNAELATKKKGREDVLRLNKIEAESYMMAGIHSKAINQKAQTDWRAGMLGMEKMPAPMKRIANEQKEEDYDPFDQM